MTLSFLVVVEVGHTFLTSLRRPLYMRVVFAAARRCKLGPLILSIKKSKSDGTRSGVKFRKTVNGRVHVPLGILSSFAGIPRKFELR